MPHKTMEVWLMELSVKKFLDSVSNPRTKKGYKKGIQEFCKWFDKTAEEILQIRKEDLTQIAGDNISITKTELQDSKKK